MNEAKTSDTLLLTFHLIVIFLAITAMIVIPVCIYRSASNALEAEETLHTNEAVFCVLSVYLRENPGCWPKSWDDLEKTTVPPHLQQTFSWPEDIHEMKKRVHVEFGLTLQEVSDLVSTDDSVRYDFSSFTAVRPIGPNFGSPDPEIKALLELIREQLGKK
jgi:hypothetical protein